MTCSYLRFLHLNDPARRDDDSSMGAQRAWFFYVMEQKTRHLVVKLKEKNRSKYNNEYKLAFKLTNSSFTVILLILHMAKCTQWG